MNRERPSAGRALGALMLGAVLIGLAPIFVRLADVGPVACAFWRTALAWPLLLLLARRGAAPAETSSPRVRLGLLACGLFFAADLGLWHYAVQVTSVANATLLANVSPLFVALAAWLLWRERPSRGFALGLLLAMGGAAILVGQSAGRGTASASGDALAIVAAAFYAAYLIGVARLRQCTTTLRLLAATSLAAAAALLPAALLLGETLLPQSARGWAVLGALALLSQVGGQGLIAYSLATLPAAFSAVGLLVQPLAAAMFAWLLLAEPFGARQALGGAVVLAGIVICRLRMAAPAPPAAAPG